MRVEKIYIFFFLNEMNMTNLRVHKIYINLQWRFYIFSLRNNLRGIC